LATSPPLDALLRIPGPAYVADLSRLRANLRVIRRLKEETDCSVLLALKAFSMFSLADEFRGVVDGVTASGLYEARLGAERFGGETHVYSPAYTDEEIAELLPFSSHLYFNSVAQLRRHAPSLRKKYGERAVVGLRVNPGISLVKNSSLYDPSSPGCRFGVAIDAVTEEIVKEIDLLHVHNLCENMAADSVALIRHVEARLSHVLPHVRYLNLGGGHYVTHPDYDVDALIAEIDRVQARYGLQVILEPGGAFVYDAGYLVATVVDIVENARRIAVLDVSATCHMPDVLEMPYRPHVVGAGREGELPHDCVLAGKTCLAGDVIGAYSFPQALAPGDRIVFSDMMQYTMVKNTTFNGVALPDIGALEEDGTYRLVKRFSYADFEGRLS
jgi:carboxynorspermidine decarboxylase